MGGSLELIPFSAKSFETKGKPGFVSRYLYLRRTSFVGALLFYNDTQIVEECSFHANKRESDCSSGRFTAVLCTVSVVKANCVQDGAITNCVRREINISPSRVLQVISLYSWLVSCSAHRQGI